MVISLKKAKKKKKQIKKIDIKNILNKIIIFIKKYYYVLLLALPFILIDLFTRYKVKLNTLFTAAMKYPEIKSNVYLNKYLQEFINIQSLLQPYVVEYNKTLKAFKGLINSPIGQILAPAMRIKCDFVEYYIPEN